MVGNDVMSPPLRKSKGIDRIQELNNSLTRELNWFSAMWNEERTAYLSERGKNIELQEQIKELESTVSHYTNIVTDLKTDIQVLSKSRKLAKRHKPNYKKTTVQEETPR